MSVIIFLCSYFLVCYVSYVYFSEAPLVNNHEIESGWIIVQYVISVLF
jgi:hypothetical protein